MFDLLSTLSLQDVVDGTQVAANVVTTIDNTLSIIDRIFRNTEGSDSRQLQRIADALMGNITSLNSDLSKDFPIANSFSVRSIDGSIKFSFIQTLFSRVDAQGHVIVESGSEDILTIVNFHQAAMDSLSVSFTYGRGYPARVW